MKQIRSYSLFWRFYLPILGTIFVAGSIAVFVISTTVRNLFCDIQQKEGLTLMENVVHIVSNYESSLRQFRLDALNYKKKVIKSILKVTKTLFDTYYNEVKQDEITIDEAKRMAYLHMRNVSYGKNDYIFAVDTKYNLVVHPDPHMINVNLYNLQDIDGVFIIRKLVEAAMATDDGEIGFVKYKWYRKGKQQYEPKLSGAFYYKPFNWIIGTGVYIKDIDEMVEHRKKVMLKKLRLQLSRIKIGKTGYIFIFDQNGQMIYHPLIQGKNAIKLKLKDPVTGRLMYDELVEAAKKPWGKNFLEYMWNHPDDKEHFIYPKISWCAREKNTGWYIVASMYKEDVERPVRKFVRLVIFSTVVILVILGIILLILLMMLLRPIRSLCLVCDRVRNGDFSVRAPEDIEGEIGFLVRQFNRMVASIDKLRQEDKKKTAELELLNNHLEDLVHQRTMELAEKTRELEKAVTHLKELDKMKSAFLSSVSHELRTPLTSILGFAKLIYRDFKKSFLPLALGQRKLEKKGKRIEDNLMIITEEGERLTRLINDVLDLAKIESGRIEWKDTIFDAGEFLERAARAVEGQFVAKPAVDFVKDIPDDLPEIQADKDRLIQVVINLLNNAAKFTEKGSVILSARVIDGKLRVSVKDTGPGISPDDLNKIFDKFHQVSDSDTLKDKPKGTGLGLAICKQIIEHYGGKIWVESEYGRGSEFIFEIPVKTEEKNKEFNEEAENEKLAVSGYVPVILVVDDDAGIRSFLKQLLEDEGYKVLTAEHGQEALEQARKIRPDLITMDIMMPVMDGREAIKKIRENDELAEVPIVVVSVMSDVQEAGGDASLTKPIDDARLLEIVKSLLHKKELSSKPCIVLAKEEVKIHKGITLCRGEVLYCSMDELWSEIESGFSGTVMISGEMCEHLDLEKLSKVPGIQVVVLS